MLHFIEFYYLCTNETLYITRAKAMLWVWVSYNIIIIIAHAYGIPHSPICTVRRVCVCVWVYGDILKEWWRVYHGICSSRNEPSLYSVAESNWKFTIVLFVFPTCANNRAHTTQSANFYVHDSVHVPCDCVTLELWIWCIDAYTKSHISSV